MKGFRLSLIFSYFEHLGMSFTLSFYSGIVILKFCGATHENFPLVSFPNENLYHTSLSNNVFQIYILRI